MYKCIYNVYIFQLIPQMCDCLINTILFAQSRASISSRLLFQNLTISEEDFIDVKPFSLCPCFNADSQFKAHASSKIVSS